MLQISTAEQGIKSSRGSRNAPTSKGRPPSSPSLSLLASPNLPSRSLANESIEERERLTSTREHSLDLYNLIPRLYEILQRREDGQTSSDGGLSVVQAPLLPSSLLDILPQLQVSTPSLLVGRNDVKSQSEHGGVESSDVFVRSVVDEDRLSLDQREFGEEGRKIQRLSLSVLVEPSRRVGGGREGGDSVGGKEEGRGRVGESDEVEFGSEGRRLKDLKSSSPDSTESNEGDVNLRSVHGRL